MSAPKEPSVSGERTGVWGFQHQMVRVGQHGTLAPGKSAPKHEYDGAVDFVDCPDHGIGEFFPPFIPVGGCSMGPYGQYGVQQKHTLLGPMGKASVIRNLKSDIYSAVKAEYPHPSERRNRVRAPVPVRGRDPGR